MDEALDDELYARIAAFGERGNEFADEEKYDEAIEQFLNGLALVPEPFDIWEASTWLLTSLGDIYFLKGDFERATMALNNAMHCPDAIGNPFIHMRLGQSQFELGNLDRAKDELVRAYMGGGEEIFQHDDPKYLSFAEKLLQAE